MIPHADFWVLVVMLLFIGNEVTQVKRKLEKLEEALKPSSEDDVKGLQAHLDWRFDNAATDLKNAVASLEYDIGTIQGDKLERKLDDISEKLDELAE